MNMISLAPINNIWLSNTIKAEQIDWEWRICKININNNSSVPKLEECKLTPGTYHLNSNFKLAIANERVNNTNVLI